MRLRGYDLLETIRQAGKKPSHVVLYLFPVKIMALTPYFMDNTLCTRDEVSRIDEYELDALRGLDVLVYGKRKDDRLRDACRTLTRLAGLLVVGSGDHVAADIFYRGKWS